MITTSPLNPPNLFTEIERNFRRLLRVALALSVVTTPPFVTRSCTIHLQPVRPERKESAPKGHYCAPFPFRVMKIDVLRQQD